MREKTDLSKAKDGRGIVTEKSYEAWKTAREAKSIGTACALYDPIQRRTVNLLSQGEKKVFWALRWATTGAIYEQYPMNKDIVTEICRKLGYPAYSKVLSTDFLVEKPDGDYAAFSIKPNAKVLEGKDRDRLIRRNNVEYYYWARFGVAHAMLFADDIDPTFAWNIRDVMFYWDSALATDTASKFMFLLAHKVIQIDMTKGRIYPKELSTFYDVEEIYEAFNKQK